MFWLPQPPTILFFAFYPSDRQLLMSDREGDERERSRGEERVRRKKRRIRGRQLHVEFAGDKG